MSIPVPNDVLFMEPGVYSWRAKDECSISAFWIGKHEENIRLTTELLADGKLPACEVERVVRNREFSLHK
jgi:hypothetical protein